MALEGLLGEGRARFGAAADGGRGRGVFGAFGVQRRHALPAPGLGLHFGVGYLLALVGAQVLALLDDVIDQAEERRNRIDVVAQVQLAGVNRVVADDAQREGE